MKRALITIALLAVVASGAAGIASAQGDLTLEGLAKRLDALLGRVDTHEQRLAALETRTAPTPTATPVPAPDTVLVVTIARGNVRAGPGTHHAIVGSVSQGEALEGPYQESGGWYQFCCTDDGENAWISATLVSVKQEGELTAWEEARNAAFEIDRQDLIRNNELHIGKLVYFDDAQVVQALEDGMIVNRIVADGIGKTLILLYPHTPCALSKATQSNLSQR